MQTNQIPQGIFEKIQKLINLRDGASSVGSIYEAENAAARIQEFLLKYNLTEEEVNVEGSTEKKIKMGRYDFDLDPYQAKTEAGWLLKLITVLASSNLCKVVHIVSRRHNYDQGWAAILGEELNVGIVVYTVEQLINKIQEAEKLSWKNYRGIEKRNTFKRGFLVGAASGIMTKLHLQEEQLKKDNPGMALMVISKKEAVSQFVKEEFNNLRSSKPTRGTSSQDGRARGYEAGKNMNINKGLIK